VSQAVDGFHGALLAAGGARPPLTSAGLFFFVGFSLPPGRSGKALEILFRFGGEPADPKTHKKDITPGTPVSATYALGSQFFMQLAKPAQPPNQPTPISSMYALSNANIMPAISDPTLFPNNVVIEYHQSTSANTKLFTATHLGTVTVTITPDDTSISQGIEVQTDQIFGNIANLCGLEF